MQNSLGVKARQNNSVISEPGEKNFWLSRTWGWEGVKENRGGMARRNGKGRTGAIVERYCSAGVCWRIGVGGGEFLVCFAPEQRNLGWQMPSVHAVNRICASKEHRGAGIKEDVGSPPHLSYKEKLPVKNNTPWPPPIPRIAAFCTAKRRNFVQRHVSNG